MGSRIKCALREVQTRCGTFHIASTSKGVLRVFFPGTTETAMCVALDRVGAVRGEWEPRWMGRVAEELAGYFDGVVSEFTVPLDFSNITDFKRRIYTTLAKVPFGETLTYGELAGRCGSPNGARAVGSAMRHNSVPIFVPCHRVVPVSGGIGGWSGPPGWKERLLAMERKRV